MLTIPHSFINWSTKSKLSFYFICLETHELLRQKAGWPRSHISPRQRWFPSRFYWTWTVSARRGAEERLSVHALTAKLQCQSASVWGPKILIPKSVF